MAKADATFFSSHPVGESPICNGFCSLANGSTINHSERNQQSQPTALNVNCLLLVAAHRLDAPDGLRPEKMWHKDSSFSMVKSGSPPARCGLDFILTKVFSFLPLHSSSLALPPPDQMPEDVPDRTRERMPEDAKSNVTVGITQSKQFSLLKLK